MMRLMLTVVLAVVSAAPPIAAPDAVETTPLVRAMQDELDRSFSQLSLEGMARTYFLAYAVDDVESILVSASYGAAVSRNHERHRSAKVELRVGDASFDNTNFDASWSGSSGMEMLPIEDDYQGLRHELWLATDRAYKDAVETLEKKRAARQAKTVSPDRAGDFTLEPRARSIAPKSPALPDTAAAETLVTRVSAIFADYPDIHDARVSLSAARRVRYLISSDKSLVVEPRTITHLQVTCYTQADDGMTVHDFFAGTSLDATLPADEQVIKEARRIADELVKLRRAPLVDDYEGPVLFEPEAAAQLLRALFDDSLSGTLPAEEAENSGFARRMGIGDSELARKLQRRVLPRGFTLVDDPTMRRFGTSVLAGFYAADDEGVPAARVTLVHDGILSTLLMSRSPRKGFDHSNGHGRASATGLPRGRIANLLLNASGGVSAQALRQRLLAQARQENLAYALVVRRLAEPGASDVEAFTMGGDSEPPQAPPPVVMVRLTPDGKETLVRGGTFSGVTVGTLEKILAVGREPFVYNYLDAGLSGTMGSLIPGSPGAGIPSAVVTPALLLEKVEVRVAKEAHQKPPAYARPLLK